MKTRNDLIYEASLECLKECYKYALPKVTWEEFENQNKVYSKVYKEWEEYHRAYSHREEYPEQWERMKENYKLLEWENKSVTECIGPRPYEFYYLDRKILKDIADSYIYAYRLDAQQNLLDIITILKSYCNNPIVDKCIQDRTDENGNFHPGYKSYEHPDNLRKEVAKILNNYSIEEVTEESDDVIEICNKFFEFLDMAGKFFNWNTDLNSFNMSVYLGPSPNSNKEAVIENWKKYRGKDIEIDEQKQRNDYYEEELD